MRLFVGFLVCTLGLSGVAFAQGAAPPPASPSGVGYVEGVAQSAFGNVTSQSYGAEAGITILPNVQLFIEVGRVTNAAPSTLGANAAVIAGALGLTQANVGYGAKEPITFGDAGARYLFAGSDKLAPYVMVGGGIARVEKKVTFSVGGTDVTNSLGQYFISLGTDLSGSETKPMITVGGGVGWYVRPRVVIDLQYRYGRVFATDEGINVSRAGVGLGLRF